MCYFNPKVNVHFVCSVMVLGFLARWLTFECLVIAWILWLMEPGGLSSMSLPLKCKIMYWGVGVGVSRCDMLSVALNCEKFNYMLTLLLLWSYFNLLEYKII